jgi:hypothetical protein
MSKTIDVRVKVADEAWIVTALLHREHPDAHDFTIEEIMDRARAEHALAGDRRAGFYVHVVQHCVANRPPNPGRYRMLFETAPGRRRLFHAGDSYHANREGAKIVPDRSSIPAQYADLLTWYDRWNSARDDHDDTLDPLVALKGSGKSLWADEHADEYVLRLREGW